MNVFLKVMLSFALCSLVGILPASPVCLLATETPLQAGTGGATIPNHHIFFRTDKRAPLTKIEIVFLGAGGNREQPGQIEIARTVSKLIWESAKKQGHIDQLAVLGTHLNFSANTTSSTISVSTLSENCAESIKIIRDVIYNLEFSKSNLDDVKKQRVVYYQNHFKRKPYIYIRNFALAQTKVIKTYKPLKLLKDLSTQDVRQYYERLLKAEVVFFKIISDRDSTEVANWLRPITEAREIHLLRQAGGFVYSLADSATDHHSGPTAFVFENYSNLKNVFCYWLIPCGSTGEEDYIPNMIRSTLGRYGAPGLLYKYFREELGLVYSIQCDYRSSENVRFLEISADPQLPNSNELIQKLSKFILRLHDNPHFWEGIKELRESRNVAYAHVHERLTPQQRLNNEVYRAIYNPPIRKGGYDAVTDAEVLAFLKKYFVSENMIMIFLGPKDYIIDILNTHWPEVEIHVQSVQSLIE